MSRTLSKTLSNIVEASLFFTGERNRSRTIALMADDLQARGLADIQTSHGPMKLVQRRGPFLATMVKNFHEDEPETLAWIDDYVQVGEEIWDIGANVGLYTLYAARRGAKVTAFEPSALNYALIHEQLAANDFVNDARVYNIGLSDETGVDTLFVKDLHAGNVFNTVGQAANQFGAFDAGAQQAVLTFTVDDFIEFAKCEVPKHIKLDVDGIELKILKGAQKTLAKIQTLLIEIEGDNAENQQMKVLIEEAGLADITDELPVRSKRNRLFIRK